MECDVDWGVGYYYAFLTPVERRLDQVATASRPFVAQGWLTASWQPSPGIMHCISLERYFEKSIRQSYRASPFGR